MTVGGSMRQTMRPAGVLMKGDDRKDIAANQHGQDDAGRFARAEELGHDEHIDEARAGKAALGKADAKRREDRERPLERGEVREHAAAARLSIRRRAGKRKCRDYWGEWHFAGRAPRT